MWRKIFHTGVLLNACFLFSYPAYGETYRPSADQERRARVWEEPEPWNRLEVTAGGYYRFSSVKTTNGTKISGGGWNWNGSAGIWVAPWLLAGVETSVLKEDANDVFKGLKQRETGGIVKFNLTPQTIPQQYLLFGLGVRTWEYELKYAGMEEGDIHYYRAGIGVEGEILEHVLLGVEWRITYLEDPGFGDYLKASSRWENAIGVRIGVGF